MNSYPTSVTCDCCGARSPRLQSRNLMKRLLRRGWTITTAERPGLLCPACHGAILELAEKAPRPPVEIAHLGCGGFQ